MPENEVAERRMTAAEVAQLWGVSKDSVAILLRTGRLKGFKVGRSWRVSPESVRAYEAENVNKNPAPPPVSKRRIVTRIY